MSERLLSRSTRPSVSHDRPAAPGYRDSVATTIARPDPLRQHRRPRQRRTRRHRPRRAVTIVSKETNLTRDTTTNEDGTYSLVNVLAGTYDVKVSLQGFREAVRVNVPVSVGQIARIEVTMEVGTLTETITVESATQLLQTDKAVVNTELRSAEITAMPTNQFRNYQALVNLVPGATPARFQNAETDTPARSLATNVNGAAINNNATRTDGATNVNIWLPSHNMYVSPAETVDTVNVSTSNFDAEQGMAGGAAITVVTKSGTNQLKGSAFEFFNSDKLNATPYFFGNAAAKPDKLPVKRNIFGGTIGGPIRQNKLFFFGSYEGYKSTQSLFTFFNVPDAALRGGDFSNARNADGSLQVIYDPTTGNADGTGRTPFANNQIPASRIDPIARKILDLFPQANTGGIGAGNLTNNYQRGETRTTDRHNYDVKINWNRTSSHQIWGKASYMDAVVDDLTNYLGPDPNAEGDGGFTKVYSVHGGSDVDARHVGHPGQHVRLLASEAGSARSRFPGRQLRTGRARAARHERCRHGRRTLRRLSALRHRLQLPRQSRRLEPDLPRRADLLVRHQRHEGRGFARVPRRLHGELPLSRSLAA